MARRIAGRSALQSPLNLSDDHLDSDRIVSAPRHDNVSVPLARLDELEVHRLYRRQVLLDYLVERSSSFVGVALDATNEANVGIRVDEDFDITKVSQAVVHEQQDSVDHHHVGGFDARRLRAAQMGDEIVLGLLD